VGDGVWGVGVWLTCGGEGRVVDALAHIAPLRIYLSNKQPLRG